MSKKTESNIDPNSEFLFERKAKHAEEGSADDKFDVIVPRKNLIIIIAIFAALFIAQFYYFSGWYHLVLFGSLNPEEYYWWAPLVFLALTPIIIIAYANVGARFASKSIVKYLEKTTQKGKLRIPEFILGYPMRTKDLYYLEAFPEDLDLGNSADALKRFIIRVLNVLFLSMGMSMMISQTVAPYIYAAVHKGDPGLYQNMEEMIIDMMLYLGPFTLIILSIIMPVFWIAEDVQVYRITPAQDSVRVGLFMKSGILSKILSFFGIVLVYNVAQEFATALAIKGGADPGAGMMADPAAAIQIYVDTFTWFGLILAMSAAIPFLVTFIYLGYFHERWVNNTRVKASEFMPIGTMEIRKPRLENMQYLKKPEKLDETGGFFQTQQGKILLLVLLIVASIICIYLAFVLGFEDYLF